MTPARVKAGLSAAAVASRPAAERVQTEGCFEGEGTRETFPRPLRLVALATAKNAVGWHWAFLPTFLAELVPGLDLVPTWTAAAFFVTRGQGNPVPPRAEPPTTIDTEVISSSPSGKSTT
jgi:hypothetical protein